MLRNSAEKWYRLAFSKGAYNNVVHLIKYSSTDAVEVDNTVTPEKESTRLAEFRKKLSETPDMELNETQAEQKKDDPLPPWPDNTNPHTGEIGGPRGLEPTRYGDWERKGIASDF